MKKFLYSKLIIPSVFLVILNIVQSYAQLDSNISENPIINVTQYQMSGLPNVGDTISMHVEFTSLISAQVLIGSIFDDNVLLVGAQTGDKFHMDTLLLDSGQNYVRDYYFVVTQSGYSNISFLSRLLLPIPGYEVTHSKTTSLKSDNSNGAYLTPPNNDNDNTRIIYDELFEGLGATGGNHNFHIEGNVSYFDWWEAPIGNKPTYPEVRLWFKRNNGNPYYDFRLFHPINPASGYIESVHYAKCDKNGHFVFDFSVPNGGINPADNLEIWIMTCKGNDALDLYSGSEHKKINLVNQNNEAFKRCFLNDYEMKKLSIDPNTQNHIYDMSSSPIRLNDFDGQIIRYITMSRNFFLARFNDVLPWTTGLPKIETHRLTNYYASGTYGNKILTLKSLNGFVAMHEYGHYAHHTMSTNFNSTSYAGNSNKTEGFARFIVTAIFAWASHSSTYNESFDPANSAESRPFDYSYGHRFGWKPGDVPIEQMEFECYLWNVYDSYHDDNFSPLAYDQHNNDDVSGLGTDLLTQFSLNAYINNAPWDFHDFYKGTISDSYLQESIQKIKDCMAAGDVPIGSVPPMRPAQIKQGSSSVYQGLGTSLTMNWDSQSYASGSIYRNFETGYKVYSGVGTGGTLLATLNPGTTSYTDSFDGQPCECLINFTITSYNSSSGNSFQPVVYGFDFRIPWQKLPEKSENEEPSSSFQAEILPNPVKNSFELNIKILKESDITIDVYDLQFHHICQLLSSHSNGSEFSSNFLIDDKFTNGAYFLRISIDNKDEHLNKFIKFIVDK